MIEPLEKRIRLGIGIVAAGVFLAFFTNDIQSRIDLQTERWEPSYLFPLVLPVGSDFREGLFYPAKILLQGKSPFLDYQSNYPPFTILLAVPFRLFDVDTAYLLQVMILYGLNILTIWTAVKIADFAAGSAPVSYPRRMIGFTIFILISFLILTSYGFLFSIERGNYDAYAQAAAILGLWLLLKKPENVWLQALAFSVAAHLKIYPAVLFLLLLWRHGRRSLLPLGVINVLLLLSIGPANALQFLEVMVRYAREPFLWVGNHSAASFSYLVNGYLATRLGLQVPTAVFYVLPTAVWLFGGFLLLRRGYSPTGAVWMYVLSVPLMSVIPSTSHDYKLILLGAPVAMTLLKLLLDLAALGEWIRLLQIGAVMALMLFLTRSYATMPAIIGNKYPFILALELVFVWTFLNPHFTGPSTEGQNDAALSTTQNA
ncbi:MAG TPA: glycosyltransferase family 87 protein [Anaerolineales bacterium]|nr:glycosyltransferase family 87 protein [Anaerolineales bacterium]